MVFNLFLLSLVIKTFSLTVEWSCCTFASPYKKGEIKHYKSRGATEQSTLDERGQFHENSIPILKVEYSCIYNNLQNR